MSEEEINQIICQNLDEVEIPDDFYKAIILLRDKYFTMKKENIELKEMLIHRLKYSNKLEQDLFENASNYVISKEKIKNKIQEVESGKENYTFEKLTSEDIRKTIITNLNDLLE